MNFKIAGKNWINKILIFFVTLNIIGDIGNIIFWYAVPSSQGSLIGGEMGGVALKGGIIKELAGANAALAIGTAVLAIVAVIYMISLFGLLKKQRWGALLVIVISIINRIMAVFLYEISTAFAFWGVWTIILVVVGYFVYRKLSTTPQTPIQ